MDNPPAFPAKQFDEDGEEMFYPGMRLRDYAALQALKGTLANPGRDKDRTKREEIQEAIEYADEYLRVREEEDDDEQG